LTSINKILIVGFGSIGKKHLKSLRLIFPDSEIAVFRRNDSSLIPAEADYLFTKWEQVSGFKPDIALICTPASKHIEAVRILAPLGVHLFIEKPMTASLDQAMELTEIVSNSSIHVMLGYHLRFSPSLIFYKKCIDERLVGDVLSVRCEVGQNISTWRPGTNPRESVSTLNEMGGGVLLELSHEIDYLRWIFGEMELIGGLVSRKKELNFEVEDEANLIFEIKDEASNSKLCASINLDFLRWDSSRYCFAIGGLGTLKWDGILGQVLLLEKDSNSWRIIFASKNDLEQSYLNQFMDFSKNLKEEKTSHIAVIEGLKTLKTIDLIKSSCPVKVI
jgi:predicted dehydrogenase